MGNEKQRWSFLIALTRQLKEAYEERESLPQWGDFMWEVTKIIAEYEEIEGRIRPADDTEDEDPDELESESGYDEFLEENDPGPDAGSDADRPGSPGLESPGATGPRSGRGLVRVDGLARAGVAHVRRSRGRR